MMWPTSRVVPVGVIVGVGTIGGFSIPFKNVHISEQ